MRAHPTSEVRPRLLVRSTQHVIRHDLLTVATSGTNRGTHPPVGVADIANHLWPQRSEAVPGDPVRRPSVPSIGHERIHVAEAVLPADKQRFASVGAQNGL